LSATDLTALKPKSTGRQQILTESGVAQFVRWQPTLGEPQPAPDTWQSSPGTVSP
jgi:hypothetical protein